MSDTARLAFIAGFWQGAYEFGAGGDEVTDDEVDGMFDEWIASQEDATDA